MLRGELFIDKLAMADGHDANRAGLPIDGVDNAEPANAKLPQSVEFAQQWLATFGVSSNGSNR